MFFIFETINCKTIIFLLYCEQTDKLEFEGETIDD